MLTKLKFPSSFTAYNWTLSKIIFLIQTLQSHEEWRGLSWVVISPFHPSLLRPSFYRNSQTSKQEGMEIRLSDWQLWSRAEGDINCIRENPPLKLFWQLRSLSTCWLPRQLQQSKMAVKSMKAWQTFLSCWKCQPKGRELMSFLIWPIQGVQMSGWFLSCCSVKWRLKWVSWKLLCHCGCLSHLMAKGLISSKCCLNLPSGSEDGGWQTQGG